MCDFSCDRDFESCFTTIPEIRAQLLMAAEPNICEGRLIPLTGGSWVVAALDGPHILASKLPNIFKFVPKWRHFTSSSNSSAPSFSLGLSIWGLTDSSKKRDNPISPFLPAVEHQKILGTRYPCKEGQWSTLLGPYMQKAGDTCDISPQFFFGFSAKPSPEVAPSKMEVAPS